MDVPDGRVVGTDDATPLEFWVAVSPGRFLQLDDVVAVERTLPDGTAVRIYGVVTQVRARHEGARFDSDVFLIEQGVLPAETSEAARVAATRFDPEIYVPPLPGLPVVRATGEVREDALLFSTMERRVPAGLSRRGEPIYLNLEFLDGTRGAHVNISGVSGVATKTTYAMFLLYSLFGSGVLGEEARNTRVLVFNVKGEDLLWLDHPNRRLDDDQRARYQQLGLEPGPFDSVRLWAPPLRGGTHLKADTGTRDTGVDAYAWTLEEFCREELLPFLFADVADERQQYTMVVHTVTTRLKQDAKALGDGAVAIHGTELRSFGELARFIADRVEDEETRDYWAGRAITAGTVGAFQRRLLSAVPHVEHLIRGDVPHPDRHRVTTEGAKVTVVDIHNLNDRAQRFVVGVLLRRTFEEKERTGQARPLWFVVLDELNKYAPREGTSPIKEILLDIAERGRSLGIILIGAEQTASEVERRIIANSAIRVVGRLDAAEAAREEYGFLPTVHRQRATISKPGTMILSQPELPIPLVVEFPFPSWATRPSEAGARVDRPRPADPFDGVTDALPF